MELKHLKTEEISGKYISLKLINTLITLITISGGIFLPFLLVNIKEGFIAPAIHVTLIDGVILFFSILVLYITHKIHIRKFEKGKKIFDDLKNEKENLLILKKQEKILKNLKILHDNTFTLGKEKDMLLREESYNLQNKIFLYEQKDYSDVEKFYKIAYEIENFENPTILIGKFKQIAEMFKEARKRKKKILSYIGYILFFLHLIVLGIALILEGEMFGKIVITSLIGTIALILYTAPGETTKYGKPIRDISDENDPIFPFFKISMEKNFLQEKMQKYFEITRNSQEIHPESSLIFADIVELFSEKMVQSDYLLWKYSKKWNGPLSAFVQTPQIVIDFLRSEEEKILHEMTFLKKSIYDFSEQEKQKITKIGQIKQEKFGHIELFQKRQELLLSNLEKLQK